MEKVTLDQKLELLEQIRSRYHENCRDLRNREQILYGKHSAYEEYEDGTNGIDNDQEVTFSTLGFRILISVGLFLLIIFCDMSGKRFLGISAQECFSVIEKDYKSSITAWVDAASDTTIFETDTSESSDSPTR